MNNNNILEQHLQTLYSLIADLERKYIDLSGELETELQRLIGRISYNEQRIENLYQRVKVLEENSQLELEKKVDSLAAKLENHRHSNSDHKFDISY